MNCKPGDIAVVVRATHAPENLGALVKILRARTSDELTQWPTLPEWQVETLSSVTSMGIVSGVNTKRPAGYIMFWHDAHLRPLQPPPEDEVIDEREPILVETKP